MSPVPASAIVIVDDGIIIDAEVLAPKLGLSAEALKGEMRKGIVQRRRDRRRRGRRTHTAYFQVSHASLDRGGRARRRAGRERRIRRQSTAGAH